MFLPPAHFQYDIYILDTAEFNTTPPQGIEIAEAERTTVKCFALLDMKDQDIPGWCSGRFSTSVWTKPAILSLLGRKPP